MPKFKSKRTENLWRKKIAARREARLQASSNLQLVEKKPPASAAAHSVSDRLNQYEARLQNRIVDLQAQLDTAKMGLQVLQDMVKDGLV